MNKSQDNLRDCSRKILNRSQNNTRARSRANAAIYKTVSTSGKEKESEIYKMNRSAYFADKMFSGSIQNPQQPEDKLNGILKAKNSINA